MDTRNTLTVILEDGISEDKADNLADAISLLDGVSSVNFNLSEFDKWLRNCVRLRSKADEWLARIAQRHSEEGSE